MTEQKLKHFENLLRSMRQDLISEIEGEMDESTNPFNIDGDKEDKAELQMEHFNKEKLSDSQRLLLDQIHLSLHQLQEGTFGVCSVCGNPIEEERLEAIPYAQSCLEHKEES